MESDQIVISSGHVPFACGGPIYVPDLVSPITSVADFKFAILRELQGLEAELVPAVDDFDGELSVDELRVFSEEELVERALGEGFEDSSGNAGPSQLTENANGEPMDHPSVAGKEIVCSGDSAIENEDMGSSASLSTSAMETMASCSGKKLQSKKSKKRGRVFDRHSRAAELEGSYFSRVQELAKIKQKQDEDKLAARLHSFSGNSMSSEGTNTTSEKIERMRSLRFITHPVKKKSFGSQEHVPLCCPEVVLCVEIYHNKTTSKKLK